MTIEMWFLLGVIIFATLLLTAMFTAIKAAIQFFGWGPLACAVAVVGGVTGYLLFL